MYVARLICTLCLAATSLVAWFGLPPTSTNWQWSTNWLTSFDVWMIDHAAYPSVLAIDLSLGFATLLTVVVVRRLFQHFDAMEAREKDFPALLLPTMPIIDVAEYIEDRSAWGHHRLLRLVARPSLDESVAAEIRRAALLGSIRVIGTPTNLASEVVIDRRYWEEATIDEGRIWDRRNNFFTIPLSVGDYASAATKYQHGRIPIADVMKVWPAASKFLRMRVALMIRLRRPAIFASSLQRDT
jgi:hypothetical protein